MNDFIFLFSFVCFVFVVGFMLIKSGLAATRTDLILLNKQCQQEASLNNNEKAKYCQQIKYLRKKETKKIKIIN